MTEAELIKLLNQLRALPHETEWFEFKEAKNKYDFSELGKYFSALSNEANLKDQHYGWLIFGINDKTREIVGTKYRDNEKDLDSLKEEIAQKTNNRITFNEIYTLYLPEGRVIMFQIPAASPGIPTSWEGHFYGREGESLNALSIQEIEQIRGQVHQADWSAQICDKATIKDLNEDAIQKARIEFKKKFPNFATEVDHWNDITFLNKAKVTMQGKITNTAIVLLGKEESEHFLLPAIARISWILKDENNQDKDYDHFGPPLILNTDAIATKIRNLKYRYLPDNTLFPIELTQYENWVIRESLHNCIAHQDYKKQSKITVIEKSDELLFSNEGIFLPGSIEAVIEQDWPPKYYRNQFLANAMFHLNMIDTIGGGIKKMFTLQKNRYFPLPTYTLDRADEVTVKIIGKVIDENYTRMLIQHSDLDLKIVILLDKIQKKIQLTKDEFRILKRQNLIEGRYPNLFVAAKIASITGDKTRYIKNRAFDDAHYKQMVIAYLEKYDSANRTDIDELLMNKLSDALDETQKKKKIANLLSQMSQKDHTIKNKGTKKYPEWSLIK
ncbi:MAG: RNA-binding domain-containing protein [Candidatus Zhuqueibacterota bacterium]